MQKQEARTSRYVRVSSLDRKGREHAGTARVLEGPLDKMQLRMTKLPASRALGLAVSQS